MRILNKDAGDITLEQLNFDTADLENLRKAIHRLKVSTCYRTNWFRKNNNFI